MKNLYYYIQEGILGDYEDTMGKSDKEIINVYRNFVLFKRLCDGWSKIYNTKYIESTINGSISKFKMLVLK